MKRLLFTSILMLVMASAVEAQQPRPRQQRPHRYVHRVDPKAEAMRLLFGPNGLPALTRPADPWNRNRYYRPRRPYNRGYGFNNRYLSGR